MRRENRIHASQLMPSSTLNPPSSLHLSIVNRQRTRTINPRRLKQIAEALLSDLEIEEAELGINLVTAREMTLVNETFLRHEGSTDVITFDYAEARAALPREAKNRTRRPAARAPLSGEIFVCVDEAILQARKFGTRWQSEVVRYIIHGILHLLGHDDSGAAARRRMKREENRLLRRFPGGFHSRNPPAPLNCPREEILIRPLARQFFYRVGGGVARRHHAGRRQVVFRHRLKPDGLAVVFPAAGFDAWK